MMFVAKKVRVILSRIIGEMCGVYHERNRQDRPCPEFCEIMDKHNN